LINDLRSQGKKVILSFGGAGMGGSWAGDVNDCWEYCFGREKQVVNRLVKIVGEMNLDGVDIDYEYNGFGDLIKKSYTRTGTRRTFAELSYEFNDDGILSKRELALRGQPSVSSSTTHMTFSQAFKYNHRGQLTDLDAGVTSRSIMLNSGAACDRYRFLTTGGLIETCS